MKNWFTDSRRAAIFSQLPIVALIVSLFVGIVELRQNRQSVNDGNALKNMEMVISQNDFLISFSELQYEYADIWEKGNRGFPLDRDGGEAHIFFGLCLDHLRILTSTYELAAIQQDNKIMASAIAYGPNYFDSVPGCFDRVGPLLEQVVLSDELLAALRKKPEAKLESAFEKTDEEICHLLNSCKRS